jgi:hypothetical protein
MGVAPSSGVVRARRYLFRLGLAGGDPAFCRVVFVDRCLVCPVVFAIVIRLRSSSHGGHCCSTVVG